MVCDQRFVMIFSCKNSNEWLIKKEYSRKEMYKASTKKLQSWHQPAPKELPPMTSS